MIPTTVVSQGNGSGNVADESTDTVSGSVEAESDSTVAPNTAAVKSTTTPTTPARIPSPTPSAKKVISTMATPTASIPTPLKDAKPTSGTIPSSTSAPSTQPLPYKECITFLSPEYCGDKDQRDEFVFKYRKHNSTTRYLIVVNHHWNFTNALRFMRDTLYEKFSELYPVDFDLMNMGPSFQGDFKMVSHSLRVGGEYSYYTLRRAYSFLKGYARYNGYFLINDDAFMDPFFLQDYDLRKSWHEPTLPYMWNQQWSWNYLKNEYGIPYPRAFREAIDEVIATPVLERRCQLKNPNNQRRSLQDFFYVAAVDMPVWLKLADIFYRHRVFLEQAAPTINWCLSHNSIINCNHHNWPKVKTCVHLHPIKLGQGSSQMIAMLRMTHKNMNVVPPMSW